MMVVVVAAVAVAVAASLETRSAEITPKRSGALETQKGGENSGHIWTVHVDTLTKTHKHTWYVSV